MRYVKKNTAYEDLANAVIILAAEDYRAALTAGDPVMRSECERFFRSGWFEMLTSLDPEKLIANIRKEFTYDDIEV